MLHPALALRSSVRHTARPQPEWGFGSTAIVRPDHEPLMLAKKVAVSVGFEPTESFPSRAFEARSFGRSDTTPPQRLPASLSAKELGQ